jgi:PhoPQ-activated pathogenicity-related protein
MKSYYRFIISVVFILAAAPLAVGTPLDDYVAKPDDSYSYSLVKAVDGPGYTAYILDMTSQTWRSKDEVDRTHWKHWLTIVKPANADGDKALLWINGGSNGRPAPDSPDKMLAGIALAAGAVVADLRMVPNEPLVFPDGGRPRSEDAIIAYTFSKWLATGDDTWPLLLPMAKSAVRGMDTVQKFLRAPDNGGLDIKHFVVSGFYSQAIEDYGEMDIFSRLDTPEGQKLVAVVDPYEYRDRYANIPKFLINSSGDQFFLPDSAQFYFHDLPGEKYLRYVPNTDHGLGGSDAPQSLLVFFQSVLKNAPRPKFSWSVRDDGSIEVHTVTEPKEVKLWQATNPKARDFRLQIIGPAWKSSDLAASSPNKYIARVLEPDEGWTAFFAELTFDSGGPIPYKFTTEVHVVPDTLPFADKL